MLQRRFRKYCCPDPQSKPEICGDLSYDQCRGLCYSAGNDLSYDPDGLHVNLCENPCYPTGSNTTACLNDTCGCCKYMSAHEIPTFCGRPLCTDNSCNPQPDQCILSPKYRFLLVNLISNRLNYGRVQDPELVNPIGSLLIDGALWVINNKTGLLTLYDSVGNKLALSVTIPDATGTVSSPTGLTENQTTGFTISNGTSTAPSFLLTATTNGTISGYNPAVSTTQAFLCVDRSTSGSSYRDLVLTNGVLYATDFYNGTVDVFDSSFAKQSGYAFIDGDLTNPIPSTYAPFGITDLNGQLYVTYAPQLATNKKLVDYGTSRGYVSIFTYGGVFVKRFITRGYLNAPWGICLAPTTSGFKEGTVLVGNNGDGFINVYNADGIYLGRLHDLSGITIQLAGLWSIHTRDPTSLFFTSGPNLQTDGLIGILSNQVI